jgi:hypothetical protein
MWVFVGRARVFGLLLVSVAHLPVRQAFSAFFIIQSFIDVRGKAS